MTIDERHACLGHRGVELNQQQWMRQEVRENDGFFKPRRAFSTHMENAYDPSRTQARHSC